MKVEIELTDMFSNVLLRPESQNGFIAVPNVGDIVAIESKQWEVAKRHFHYEKDGILNKVSVQCKEMDF